MIKKPVDYFDRIADALQVISGDNTHVNDQSPTMDYYDRIADALEVIAQNPITAYDMAVAAGYSGTKSQFEEDLGNSGTNATNAALSATAAASSATSASSAITNFAPSYSSSDTYDIGDFVLYNNQLYECNTKITTAEEWNSEHWTSAKVGIQINNLKSNSYNINDLLGNVDYIGSPNKYTASKDSRISLEQKDNIIILNNLEPTSQTTTVKQRLYRLNNGIAFQTSSEANADSLKIPIIQNHKYRLLIKKFSGSITGGTLKAFIVDSNTTPGSSGTGSPASISLVDLEDLSYADFTATNNAINIVLYVTSGVLCTNFTIGVYLLDLTKSKSIIDLDSIENTVNEKLDSTYNVNLDWTKTFSDEDYQLGWTSGYYNSTGESGTSNNYLRTNKRLSYIAKTGDIKITFTVPSGKHAAIIEYDENGQNGTRYGTLDNGSNVITINVTPGYQYKFCVGIWDNNASNSVTEEFIATMTAVIAKSFSVWQKEQDEQIKSMGVEIPEYYTNESNYLQTKLNTITNIQRTLSNKSDSFLFITDYHTRTNQGKSPALLKEIASKTGIQKLFYAGDAGGRLGVAGTGYKTAFQKSVNVWSTLAKTTKDFYGTLGNHEWIYNTSTPDDVDSYGIGAMLNAYLGRYRQQVPEITENGSYYINDPICKIRYYFLQVSYGASSLDWNWFGHSLETIGNGWYVAVITHHGYIPGRASISEYDGIYIQNSDTIDAEGNQDQLSASHVYAKTITKILSAYQAHTSLSVTISGTSYSWDFSSISNNGVIGVFCGHYHHGTLFAIGDTYNDWDITVWRGSTDSLQAGTIFEETEGQKIPWYWENGIAGGTKIVRSAGTINEQCFYAVQIDMIAKTVYITAIGGDHDWQFTFN